MLAVYKREVKSYFQTVTGCLFIAVNLLILGIYYTAFNLSYGYPYVSYTIQSAIFVFLIVTPILTMRSLAEEKRQKTDQLLLTSPTSIVKIVLGKYLAMVTVFLVPVVILSIYPLILLAFGTIPLLESYVAIAGYFFFGCTCIAIGMFISSLTENQIIASVGTFGILLVSYLMTGIESLISTTGNFVTKILECFNLASRLDNILQGIFDLNGIIYFLSVTFLFLFLTYESIQKRRFSTSTKNLKLSAYSTSMTAIVIAIVVVVNFVVLEVPTKYTQLDATDNKLYELTDQTKKVAENLTDDITIYAIVREDSADTTVAQTLKRYADLSKHIKVVYKDPTVYPNFAADYTSDKITSGSLIVVSEKRSKVIDYSDLYETEVDYQTYQENKTGYDAEGQITSALDYVTSDSMPKMYVISGHNEAQLSTSFQSAVAKENIDTEDLNLMNVDAVPEDAAGIFIFSPTKDFSDDDTAKIKEYLKNGGKAVILSSYSEENLTNFDSIMKEYGVTLVDGIVVENDQQRYYQTPFLLLPNIESSELTSSISSQNRYIFIPYAQGLQIDENLRDGLSVEKLLTTSDSAYSKVNMNNAQSYDKEDGDIDGPFTLGVYVEDTSNADNTTQILYFTSENMLSDDADNSVGGSNSELVMNGISKMIDHETSVSVPVKKLDTQNLTIARSNIALVSMIVTMLLPLAFLILGIVVWVRRRKR